MPSIAEILGKMELSEQHETQVAKGIPDRYKAQAAMSMAVPQAVANVPISIAQILKNIPSLMRQSKRVLSQEPTPEYLLGMTELTGLTIGGGAKGGLPKGETGTGLFYGVQGGLKTGKIKSLRAAKDLLIKGEKEGKVISSNEIRKQTGWFKNPYDKKWRFELDDSGMKFKKDIKSREVYQLGSGTKLGELIEHEELFKAYPAFRKIEVKFKEKSGERGSVRIDPETKERIIFLNPHMSLNGTKQVIVHEVQHIIQGVENFAAGGNKEMFPSAYDLWKKGKTPPPGYDPHREYLKLAGEIEAREAAKRWGLKSVEREWAEPYIGQTGELGISAKDAIIKYD